MDVVGREGVTEGPEETLEDGRRVYMTLPRVRVP